MGLVIEHMHKGSQHQLAMQNKGATSILDQIQFGDCLQVLRTMPDASVNLIVTSPPYADKRKRTYDGVPALSYVKWFLPISAELKRVLKPNGSLILNIKEHPVDGRMDTYVYKLIIAMTEEQDWHWIDTYAWHKKNTSPGKWPNRFRNLWEPLYHFTRRKHFQMHQDAVQAPIGGWSIPRLKNLSESDMVRMESKTLSGFGKNVSNWKDRKHVLPGNVLYIAPETRNVGHSAAFPVDLPAWFILLLTRKGDTVLDPFAGSGSSLVAAKNLNRHFIGIELNSTYRNVAMHRVTTEDVPRLRRADFPATCVLPSAMSTHNSRT